MNHFNEYKRITEIVSLIRGYGQTDGWNDADDENYRDDIEDDTGITIRKIARQLGNTLPQTREDIAALAKIGVRFDSENDIADLTEKTSRFDDEPLYMKSLYPLEPDYCSYLLLSPVQRELYKKRSFKGIAIKDSPVSVSQKELERKAVIQEAIRKKQWIRFRYRGSGESTSETVEVFPRLIYHNLTNERFYCITLGDDGNIIPFRLDRIRFDVRVVSGKVIPRTDESKLTLFDYVWGGDFSRDEQPVHVKVKITENTGNIIAKIKADTNDRKHQSLKKVGYNEKNNIWLYEDDIIGEAAFRSWLRGFGSSVMVLEPQQMADAMLKTSVRSNFNYKKGRFVDDDEYAAENAVLE